MIRILSYVVFVYLYENYELDNDIILTMKSLLINDNCDEYFFNVFLPFLRNKYKKIDFILLT